MAILFVIVSYTYVSAAQFDIYYFNGVKWGSKINASSGFKLISTGTLGERYYSRKADKHSFEGIQIDEITYTTKKRSFNAAIVTFSGNDSYNANKPDINQFATITAKSVAIKSLPSNHV